MWKRWALGALIVKKVGGMPPEALETWMHTVSDGHAALALEATEIKDLARFPKSTNVFQTRWLPIVCERGHGKSHC